MKEDEDLMLKAQLIASAFSPILLIPILIVITPFVLFYSWAAWLMYGWFLQPMGMPGISYWHAVGLILTLGIIRSTGSNTSDTKNGILRIVMMLVVTLTILGIGYIIKGWI